jgi:hypothetical protein
MKLPRALRFSQREWLYIGVAACVLGAGVWLSYATRDAGWLSRFGALAIVIGVLFAFTDLPALLDERAKNLAKLRMELVFQSMLDEKEESTHELYTPEERAKLKRDFEAKSKHIFEREASLPKRRFRAVEVGIICLGTLANGWGQWLLERIWCQ